MNTILLKRTLQSDEEWTSILDLVLGLVKYKVVSEIVVGSTTAITRDNIVALSDLSKGTREETIVITGIDSESYAFSNAKYKRDLL